MSLVVVACHFNPCGYERPRQNFASFCDHMRAQRANLATIELTFDGTSRVRAGGCLMADPEKSCLFQKEALLNVLIMKLAKSYDCVAWVDADLIFCNGHWARDAERELEKNDVCQLFGECLCLDRDGDVQRTCRSVGWRLSLGDRQWCDLTLSHPGFAWAARSEWLLQRNGLYQFAVTGCGDSLMLHAMQGFSIPGFDDSIGPKNVEYLASWNTVQTSIGFVLGSVIHMYHGEIADRQNVDRRRWMASIDPFADIKVNQHGILEWSDFALKNKKREVKAIKDYFSSRKEDGVTVHSS